MVLYSFFSRSTYSNTDSIGYNSSTAVEAQQHATLGRRQNSEWGKIVVISQESGPNTTRGKKATLFCSVVTKSIDTELMLMEDQNATLIKPPAPRS
jgi:hypothetical protein